MKTFATHVPLDFALALVGRPGSGKTTLACRFPKPFVISTDKNLRGPAAQLAREGLTDIAYDDEIVVDSSGAEVPPWQQWARLNASLVSAVSSDRETIILDNGTQISDMICAEVLRQSPTKTGKMEIPSWGVYLQFWKQFVLKLRQCPKRTIMIFHERLEKDDADGTLKYFLAIPGQSSDLLPSLFTDIWRTEVVELLRGQTMTPVRMVRVVQNPRNEHLKTSIPTLPVTFEANQTEIDKILKLL
jgi:adenylate kinase family enzyme